MPWWVGTIIAGVCLAFMNALKKNLGMTPANFAILFPLLVAVQLGFWYGFSHSPNFVRCWYTGSAISAISAVTISLFVFREGFSVFTIGGVALIVAGQFLLTRG